MKRKVLGIMMSVVALLGINVAKAQMPQLTPLPLNPNVKTGVLPNKLTYFILHNEEPKERANFYIAQKVGSSLETPEQLGLAHFLEHMAFNGTSHYPGKNMLDYLQHKGIRFGEDINAYTGFDETVYNINNIPTSDRALMDSVLLVLHDWSGSILLEESEIESERGVINGEWRQRNNAQTRMYTTILPRLYKEYQYQQMPIGKMEIVMNFPPQAIRDYYHKWYRPDQQAIIVVGDFDAAEMEKKIIEMFSDIPMPEDAAPREYPVISDNKEPIYSYFTDPELQVTRFDISFKYDKTPVELRNTVEAYMQDHLLLNVIANMIYNRLNEYSQKPECKYAQAWCYFGDYYVSKTKGAFNVGVIAKDDPVGAFEDAMAIVARACKTGFTDSEVARVRDELLSSLERMYNERNKTQTESLAKELINYFVDNDPAPGIEQEFELAKQVLPMLNAQVCNQVAANILTSENQVISVSQPQAEGMVTISEEVVESKMNELLNNEYEAYVDEVITEPLIKALPKPGKIKSESANNELGATEFVLSNGARVIVKPTDYANDIVMFNATREGGKVTYPVSEAINLNLIDNTFDLTKWGPFDGVKLQKYLAGKRVALSYNMNSFTNSLQGSSTVKDLPTLMELIYTAFTGLSADTEAYNANMSQLAAQLANAEKNPKFLFNQAVLKTTYGNNPMTNPLTSEGLAQANYQQQLKLLKATMNNAADYTFVFVGNIDVEQLKVLLNQYIATIPGNAKKVKKPVEVTPIRVLDGNLTNEFTVVSPTPAVDLFYDISGEGVEYNLRNRYMMQFVGDILQIIYTETLREELGGTYGAGTYAYINQNTDQWRVLYQFQTNEEQRKEMFDRAQSELHNLLRNGAKAEHFNKVKEAAVKQLEISLRTNDYWLDGITLYYRGWNTLSNATEILNSISLDDMNTFMRSLDSAPNSLEVVMNTVVTK